MTRINAGRKPMAPVRRPPPRSLVGVVECAKCGRWWENGKEPESRRCLCGAFLPEFEG